MDARPYFFRIAVIDLDPRHCWNIPYYHQQDQRIVRKYLVSIVLSSAVAARMDFSRLLVAQSTPNITSAACSSATELEGEPQDCASMCDT